MRWAWNGRWACGRRAATTGAPNEMLSTNRPSMTSRWMESTPPAAARATSSPNRAKSAFSTLAEMCGAAPGHRQASTMVSSASGRCDGATGETAGRGAGRRRPRSSGRACPARWWPRPRREGSRRSARSPRGAYPPRRRGRRVERNEVHVAQPAAGEVRQAVGLVGSVVDAVDHHVLEADPAARAVREPSTGAEHG